LRALYPDADVSAGKKNKRISLETGKRGGQISERHLRGPLDFIGNPQYAVNLDAKSGCSRSQLLVAC
jgi:hypothetical protein